jgi:hypothetical protein
MAVKSLHRQFISAVTSCAAALIDTILVPIQESDRHARQNEVTAHIHVQLVAAQIIRHPVIPPVDVFVIVEFGQLPFQTVVVARRCPQVFLMPDEFAFFFDRYCGLQQDFFLQTLRAALHRSKAVLLTRAWHRSAPCL